MTRLAAHLGAWAAVYLFWLAATRGNQPTLPVAVAATGILVGASAAGVYADWYALRPRLAARRRWGQYAAGLAALVAGLTFATVHLIRLVYDAMGVPKAGRFGFWTNVGYETAWYSAHLAAAAGVRALADRAATKDPT